ncbi:hypothetical protein OAV62_00400 [bacterium]|nr:hypothetical protein [bacterium]
MSIDNNGDSAQPLKSALEQQLAKETLADDQLQRLMAMQSNMQGEVYPVSGAVAAPHSPRRFLPAVAVSLLLLVMGFWWQLPEFSSRGAAGDSVRDIAMEVVKNHLTLKPLEVKSRSMVEVQNFFNQLDFLPQRSTLLAQRFLMADNTMLGGRYCSIKGVTAAQLRYQSDDAEISTLYEVAYDPMVFGEMPNAVAGEEPLNTVVKGLQVSLWQEQGLLMVLVHNAAQ